MRRPLGFLLCLAACSAFIPPTGPFGRRLRLRCAAETGVAALVGPRPGLCRSTRTRFSAPGALCTKASSAEGGETTPDELIEKLLASAPYDIPQIVAQNLKMVSQPSFFIRIAELNDEATDEGRKESLSALADNLVATLEAVMARTQERMDGAASLVQNIVAKAAEPNGEFKVPLTGERVAAMRMEVAAQRELIDEGILATVFAYMKKANEDGLEGMVVIFQKLLQLWAAEELVAAGPGNDVLDRLLRGDADEWDGMIKSAMDAGETDAEILQGAVQSCVERVVLQQASGSYAQRVQAEFLRELMSRLRAGGAPPAGAPPS